MSDNQEIDETPNHEEEIHEGEYSGHNELIESFYEKKSLKQIIDDQIKSSPWWFISFAAHGVVIFLMTLIVTMKAKDQEEVVVVQSEMIEQVQDKEKEELKEKLEEKEVEVDDVEVDDVVEEEVVEDNIEVETDIEVDAFEETEVSDEQISDVSFDAPVGGEELGVFGVGDAGGAIKGGMLAARGSKKGRRKAVARGGGGKQVIETVESALKYLARVQRNDGSWSKEPNANPQPDKNDIAITGLAVLCFLGAGHTEIAGKYRKNVKNAIKFLLKQQHKNDGGFGHGGTYINGIATMALAEAAAMANKSKTKAAAQKAINWVFAAQNNAGSWGYSTGETKNKKQPDGKNDTSVAGWQMMAIKSAKLAHLKLNERKIKKALAAFDRATTDGKKNFQGNYQSPLKGHANFGTPTMTLVVMCIKEFFGMKKTDPQLVKPAKYLLSKKYVPTRPTGKENRANGYYAMYYGALVNFQMGGKYWKTWRDGMLKCLPPTQDKSGGLTNGSWAVDAVKGHQHGENKLGRTGVTCFNTLSMEVFWRYAAH